MRHRASMLKRSLLRARRFCCPDEHDLAAYADQHLIGAERERVESHIAKCDSCLQQVGFLIRHADRMATPVPARFLVGAKQFQAAPQRNSPVVWGWAGVAAAIAVVAISGALWREVQLTPGEGYSFSVAAVPPQQVPGIPSNLDPQAETSVRRGSSGVALPVILSPRPGATGNAHPRARPASIYRLVGCWFGAGSGRAFGLTVRASSRSSRRLVFRLRSSCSPPLTF